MSEFANRLGFWSSTTIALLVALIDVCMILSTILFPITTVTNVKEYANSFNSLQMLPFIPSMLLAPMFVLMMQAINQKTSNDKKVLSQLGFSFSLICAAVLSIHYYIQLTFVQQGLLSNDTAGVWQFAAPNPHSFFWTFAALGYGFMGIALLCTAPVFSGKSERSIKWLLIANGIVGITFLIGNAMGIFIVNIFSSFVWGVLFLIASVLLAINFRNSQGS